MRLKFFAIPALDPADAEAELNRFLATHRILTVDRELTAERQGSFWAIAVSYLDKDAPTLMPEGPRKPKIDYKEVLSPEDFTVFAELRSFRQETAAKEAVPPYLVFTNAQLAEMVQGRISSLEEMGRIAGIGPARLKSHGPRFLERLKASQRPGPVPDEPEGDAS